MHRFLLIIFLTVNSALVTGQAEFAFSGVTKPVKQTPNLPEMTLDREVIDLGNIVQGQPQVFEVTVTNRGEASLVISDVMTFYGCSVERSPAKEIKEHESSVIRFKFTGHRPGVFKKGIVLTANIEGGTKTLVIKGNILNP